MGMFKKHSGSGVFIPPSLLSPQLPDPNPDRFMFIRVFAMTGVFVSEIKYEGCTNFEGHKVLVTTFDPRERKRLDPHFARDNGIIARFPPTEQGYEHALTYASWFANTL